MVVNEECISRFLDQGGILSCGSGGIQRAFGADRDAMRRRTVHLPAECWSEILEQAIFVPLFFDTDPLENYPASMMVDTTTRRRTGSLNGLETLYDASALPEIAFSSDSTIDTSRLAT